MLVNMTYSFSKSFPTEVIMEVPRGILALTLILLAQVPMLGQEADDSEYLGTFSSNEFDPDSVSNPFGTYGSEFSPDSINNPFGIFGSPYSPSSVNNPYATDTPKLYGADGTYLGKLSSNPYDPESISNPFGVHGSEFSPDSINNRFSPYGSEFSPLSPNNPYATEPPLIIFDPDE